MNSQPVAFISYSHTERESEWVEQFAQALRDQGIGVWLDAEDVPAGERLADAIEKRLRSSDVIVAIIDADTAQSPWVSFEIGAALGMGKRLIAVVPNGTPSAALPAAIRARRFLERNEPTETATKVASAIAQASEAAAKSA